MNGNPLFHWVQGRQGTGYSILTLAYVKKRYCSIPFDIYLIKYPAGASIPPHRDSVKNGHHYRINVYLTRPPGGEFVSESVIYRNKRMAFFRPDLSTHSVTPVLSGTRYVLSIGWTLSQRRQERVERIVDYVKNRKWRR